MLPLTTYSAAANDTGYVIVVVQGAQKEGLRQSTHSARIDQKRPAKEREGRGGGIEENVREEANALGSLSTQHFGHRLLGRWIGERGEEDLLVG